MTIDTSPVTRIKPEILFCQHPDEQALQQAQVSVVYEFTDSNMSSYRFIANSSSITIANELDIRTSTQSTTLGYELRTRYSRFQEISDIFYRRLPEITKIFILIDQQAYDDQLIDRLLDEEIEMLKQFSSRPIEFYYYPLVRPVSELPIPKDSIHIYP